MWILESLKNGVCFGTWWIFQVISFFDLLHDFEWYFNNSKVEIPMLRLQKFFTPLYSFFTPLSVRQNATIRNYTLLIAWAVLTWLWLHIVDQNRQGLGLCQVRYSEFGIFPSKNGSFPKTKWCNQLIPEFRSSCIDNFLLGPCYWYEC